jgi:hypothetical protein
MGLLGTDFELLPFGVGRCICVGKGLTMTMLECTITSFTYMFDWALPPNTHLGVDERIHDIIFVPHIVFFLVKFCQVVISQWYVLPPFVKLDLFVFTISP